MGVFSNFNQQNKIDKNMYHFFHEYDTPKTGLLFFLTIFWQYREKSSMLNSYLNCVSSCCLTIFEAFRVRSVRHLILHFNRNLPILLTVSVIHTTLKDLLPRGVYYRFNPRLNNKVFMDEFREEKLNGLREETLKYMHHHSKRVDRFVETINKPRSTTSKIRDLWHQTSLESAFTKTKAPR